MTVQWRICKVCKLQKTLTMFHKRGGKPTYTCTMCHKGAKK